MTSKQKRFWIKVAVALALVLAGWTIGFLLRDPQSQASIAVAQTPPPRAIPRADAVHQPPTGPALPAPRQAADDPRWTRPTSEWQGMLPVPFEWPCPPSGACSMARACVKSRCVPCLADNECQHGELCALGKCIQQETAECTSSSDCPAGELCILSEPTGASLRGNAGVRSACLAADGPSPFPNTAAIVRGGERPPTTPAERVSELLEEKLRRAR